MANMQREQSIDLMADFQKISLNDSSLSHHHQTNNNNNQRSHNSSTNFDNNNYNNNNSSNNNSMFSLNDEVSGGGSESRGDIYSALADQNYMPGTASLIEDVDKQIMVVLRDGRTLIGYLRSIDQYANLLLSSTFERIHVGNKYGDIPKGSRFFSEMVALFYYMSELRSSQRG